MRWTFLWILFLAISGMKAQEDFLAKQYMNDGDYDKAVVYFEKLVKKNPRRTDFAEGLINCYQQLERYDDAQAFLLRKIEDPYVFPTFLIELGYNFTLKQQPEEASQYYALALDKIRENPNFGYSVGYRFQKYALLDEAIEAYSLAMVLKPDLKYNFQLARIYGEKGDLEKMYQSYLNLIEEGKTSTSSILRNLDAFISEDPQDPNNLLLKKVLLKNAQQKPDVLWNELLSWLFIQQKQYKSAFTQEKAIIKRSEVPSMERMESLGSIALDDSETDIANDIFTFIVENARYPRTVLNAELQRIEIKLLDAAPKEYPIIDKKFQSLLEEYAAIAQTEYLQIAYADFLTFKKNTPAPAIVLLKENLEPNLDRMTKARIKMALGDILVYDQKFNQALITFTQVQRSLKNDVLGQDARFKVAQTSFYKGDFDWALTQLKVLRSSTSQLIANDAMQLSLIISDNSLEDSTQTALKKFARADLFAYQNKTEGAIQILNDILENHKGEKIEDEALLKQGELLESKGKFEEAKFNYQKIVEFYANDILADDAHFALGELYRNQLNLPEKAKEHYEKIIYDYPNSYYFPKARKHFRRLRGDVVN
ncbi:MAG: tetratricopeptide repeat protein [Bacteroidota bacterium]